MKEYDVNVYVHIHARVYAHSDCQADLLDALFPDGWEGEVQDLTTDPRFYPRGHVYETGNVEEAE